MPETSIPPRGHIGSIEVCPHGSIGDAELRSLGLRRDDVIDLSASTNPLGPSPRVMEAIRALTPEEVGRYPEDGGGMLREALAMHLGLPPERILPANGAVEILWFLALAYLSPGDAALVVGPTFGEYARAGRVAGARIVEYRARPEDGFIPDAGRIVEMAHAVGARMIWLCNPNNPTGVVLDREALLRLKDGLSGLLAVDEAYASFADDMPDLTDALDHNLVLVRSLTKDGGLAGLRAGYALGCDEVIAHLNRVRPPWTVNVAAQRAAVAAIADIDHLERARAEVRRARDYLVSALARLGLRAVNDRTNFLLVHVGDGSSLRVALLRRGICVRDCTSFGLPAYIRIGIGTQEECAALVDALREEMTGA